MTTGASCLAVVVVWFYRSRVMKLWNMKPSPWWGTARGLPGEARSRSLDTYLVIGALLVFLGVAMVGGVSLHLVRTMMDSVHLIEEEARHTDFLDRLNNSMAMLLLNAQRHVLDPAADPERRSIALVHEIETELAAYLAYEEAAPFPESPIEVRLLRQLHDVIEHLKDILEATPRGDVTSLTLVDAATEDIRRMMRGLKTLHLNIITRKVNKLEARATFIMGLYGVFILVGTAMAWLGLLVHSRNVVVPIKALVDATRSIAGGDLSARAHSDSATEIGVLYRAFNDMGERLQTHEAALAEFNAELERRIHQRTLELQQAQRELIRLERIATLGQIATAVNHEIKTPLNALYMNLQLLRRQAAVRCGVDGLGDESIMGQIAIIDREVERISTFLDDFVGYARMAPPRLAACDINGVVTEVASMLSQKAADAKVELIMDLAPELPAITGDESKLIHALINLGVNAIDAMPDGGSLRLVTREDDHGVTIMVVDTGTGIPESDQSAVFMPFFTRKETGLGFGLAIVERTIEDHGGTIACSSTLGEGTRFTVTLPVKGPSGRRKIANGLPNPVATHRHLP